MPIWTDLQYRLLKRISSGRSVSRAAAAGYAGSSKLQILLGDKLVGLLPGRIVIDFGCGTGQEALEMARLGAGKVIGVDIREQVLQQARQSAGKAGLGDMCEFTTNPSEKADIIVSLDAFEHFEDPAAILRVMDELLKPEGEVLASFGPTWYHPLGGHTFSIFPWSHVLFSEAALIRWRADFKTDGATRFSEVDGGLNQMTIKRFERLVRESPLELTGLEAVPIRQLKPVHSRLTREFTTAVVRCRLRKPGTKLTAL